MVQFAGTLLSWLVATGQTAAGPTVLSCSDSSVAIADGSLAVGDIFIHVDADSTKLCRDDCRALFREILSDEGNGVYKTAPASFEQVLPAETYDDSQRNVSVESMLPSCSGEVVKDDRRLFFGNLFGATESAPAEIDPATVEALVEDEARKHDEDDDDKYKDDDKEVEKKEGCRAFLDATKKFIFDMYCIIRALDCTEYNPGEDDVYHDDYHYEDDYHGGKDNDKYIVAESDMPSRRMRGVKGGVKGSSSPQKRSLHKGSPETRRSLEDNLATTINMPEDHGGSGGKGSDHDDKYEDDHYYDDDFFDDE